MLRGSLGEIVEPHAGAEVAGAAAAPLDARREARKMTPHPACEHLVLAVDERRRGEDLETYQLNWFSRRAGQRQSRPAAEAMGCGP